MRSTYDVMVAGHVCLDIIPQFPDTGATAIGDLLRPGQLVQMGPAALGTGGAVSNTGIAMKRLGNRVCFSARVGDDAFGAITMGMLQKNGNVAGIRTVPGGVSSYSIVVAPPRIDRMFLHNPGTNNEYGTDDLDTNLVSLGRLFHFGYPVLMRRMYQDEGRELIHLFKTAKKTRTTTSCDLAMPDPASEAGMAPWPKILKEVLPYVDIFLPSVEEALFVLDRERFLKMKHEHGGVELFDLLSPEDYSDLSGRLLALGSKIVSLKSGYRGFYLRTGSREALKNMGPAAPADLNNWADRELWCPSFTVSSIASATGAGDCSIAGFLTTLLRKGTVEDSLRIANCLGWQNVQTFDATSGIRSWEETQSLLRAGMAMNEITVDAPGWKWNRDVGLWSGPDDRLSAM